MIYKKLQEMSKEFRNNRNMNNPNLNNVNGKKVGMALTMGDVQ
jgi:hypothetical protein